MISGLASKGQKRLFTSFREKIWPEYSLRRPRFPRRVYFRCPMTFVFVQNLHMSLCLDIRPWRYLVN